MHETGRGCRAEATTARVGWPPGTAGTGGQPAPAGEQSAISVRPPRSGLRLFLAGEGLPPPRCWPLEEEASGDQGEGPEEKARAGESGAISGLFDDKAGDGGADAVAEEEGEGEEGDGRP